MREVFDRAAGGAKHTQRDEQVSTVSDRCADSEQRSRAHGEHVREQWVSGHGTMRSWDERGSEASGDGRLGRLERGEWSSAPHLRSGGLGLGSGTVLVVLGSQSFSGFPT